MQKAVRELYIQSIFHTPDKYNIVQSFPGCTILTNGGIVMQDIITILVNNGASVALLAYFIYKDNKFTQTITAALQSINDSLEIIKKGVIKK